MINRTDAEYYIDNRMPMTLCDITKSAGSILALDMTLGATDIKVRFFVYLCDWRLRVGPDIVLDCDDDLSDLSFMKKFLYPGLKLIDFGEIKHGRLDLIFENDTKLMLKQNIEAYEPDDELLMIFFRNEEFVITYTFAERFGVYLNTHSKWAQKDTASP